MRDREPQGRRSESSDSGQTGVGSTLKRSKAYERMNPVCASGLGDGDGRKKPALAVRNGEREREWETRWTHFFGHISTL
jgi:hypothetical protein